MLDALIEEKHDAAFGATWRNDPTEVEAERVWLQFQARFWLEVGMFIVQTWADEQTRLKSNS